MATKAAATKRSMGLSLAELVQIGANVLTPIITLVCIALHYRLGALKSSVDVSLMKVKEEVIREINGKYMTKELCNERHSQTQRQLEMYFEKEGAG